MRTWDSISERVAEAANHVRWSDANEETIEVEVQVRLVQTMAVEFVNEPERMGQAMARLWAARARDRREALKKLRATADVVAQALCVCDVVEAAAEALAENKQGA